VSLRTRLGSVPGWLRLRPSQVAIVVAMATCVALLVGVLGAGGVAFDLRTWAILVVFALVAVTGVAVAIRSSSDVDRALVELADLPTEPQGRAAADGDDEVIDLDSDPALDVVDLDAVRVELRPDVLWRQRLAGRPDLLWIVGDRFGLVVPAWLIEHRPRVIDASELVTIRWPSIERFRVRAARGGPSTYDITCRAAPGGPTRWLVRRHEIGDEVTLLDHVRTVGRITVELEDSISSP
jgi:hypothetical protein